MAEKAEADDVCSQRLASLIITGRAFLKHIKKVSVYDLE
jgi:hypothetical protein